MNRIALLAIAALAFAAPAARAGQLDSLAFMAGSWAGGGDLDRVEEHWSAPRGGLMVGMHRDLRGGRAKGFEFFRVEERHGALWYLTQPGGRPAVSFRSIEVSARRVVFENPAHDFPQRIVYWQEKPGELKARIEGRANGEPRSMQWTWTTSALAPPAAAPAQGRPDPAAAMAAQREAMKQLAMLDGEWRGTAWSLSPGGEKHTLVQTERVGTMLDGTVRVIEGRGYEPDGSIGFNAFAVISYRPETKDFGMRSYTGGRFGDFTVTPTADGFTWDIPAGPMTIRHTATVKDGKWREVGDRIVPGREPVRFLEMNLERIGDSAWPAGGAVPQK